MRTALALLALVGALVSGGCCGRGCASSCDPQPDCCWTWKPDCCNSWDFYIPCNTLCGNDGNQAQPPCAQVPTCVCK